MTTEQKATSTAIDAQALSIREGRIVTIGYDDALGGAVVDALFGDADTEGNAEAGDVHEFWGTTEEGQSWRVQHVLTADVD